MKKRKNLSLLFVFVLGGLLSAAGCYLAYHIETRAFVAEFDRDASDRIAVIHRSLDMDKLLLESMRGFFDSSSEVSRTEFAAYVEPYFKSIQGIQSLGWVPAVRAEDRESCVRLARAEGFPNFEIFELSDSGETIVAGSRPVYYPALYQEPRGPGESSLGFDHGSDPVRLRALERARDNNELVATARFRLTGGARSQFDFLLAVPVYRSAAEASDPALRSSALRGFVLGVFRPQEIVEEALASLQPRGIHVMLFDKSAPAHEQLLYAHDSRLSHIPISTVDSLLNIAGTKTQKAVSFPFGSRRWSVICLPDDSYVAASRSWTPWWVLGAGLVITLLLASYLAKSLGETEKVSRLARQRTQALELMKVRFELALKGADLGVWDWNVQTGDVYMNERWTGMLGYTIDEISPHVDSWTGLLHPDDRAEAETVLQAHLAGETRIYKTEHRLLMKSGEYKWILDTGQVVEWDDVGKPLRVIGVHLDISEARDHREQLEKLSITDQLTQIHNRMKLHEELHKEVDRATRYKTPFSLIMFDVDRFKDVNDAHGHDVGDAVLVELTSIVRGNIRHVDLFARWGGDEFMIIAPNVGALGSESIAEKLRQMVELHDFAGVERVTCSFGVAEFADGDSVDTITKRADDALYAAKQGGRNRVARAN